MASMQEEYEHLAGLEPQVQGGVLVLSKQAAEVSEEGLWMDEQKVTLPADKMVLLRPLYRGFHLKQAAGEVSRLVLPTGAFENTVFSSSDREVYEEVPARFQDGFAEVTLRGECWFFCDSCRQKAVTPETEPVSAGKGLGRFYKSFLACYKVPKPVELPFVGSSAGEGKWMLLSARFDTPERMPYLRKIKQALEEKGVPTFLVDLMGGETFGMETMKALYHARAMAAFCSENYGALTGARYETFHELRYAWEHQITIMPVKLCNDYPLGLRMRQAASRTPSCSRSLSSTSTAWAYRRRKWPMSWRKRGAADLFHRSFGRF